MQPPYKNSKPYDFYYYDTSTLIFDPPVDLGDWSQLLDEATALGGETKPEEEPAPIAAHDWPELDELDAYADYADYAPLCRRKKPKQPDIMDNPVIREALELIDGRIVAIEPVHQWTHERMQDGKYYVAADPDSWNWSDPFAPGNMFVAVEPPGPVASTPDTAPTAPGSNKAPAKAAKKSKRPKKVKVPAPAVDWRAVDWRIKLALLSRIVQLTAYVLTVMDACDVIAEGRHAYNLGIALPKVPGDKTSGLDDQQELHSEWRRIIERLCRDAAVVWVRGNCQKKCSWGLFHSHFTIITPNEIDMRLLHAYLYGSLPTHLKSDTAVKVEKIGDGGEGLAYCLF